MTPLPDRPRPPRMLLRAVAFLGVFAIILVLVVNLYLIPAMTAAKDADVKQRHELAAYATLILVVVLFVLFAGLLLTFRIGRFFFPRPPIPPRKPTEYVDAWAEAGRRAPVPEEEE
jgi:O-antigen/teichoic acid export membrane protein